MHAACEKMQAATDLKIVQVGNRRLRRAPRREREGRVRARCREATTIGRVPKFPADLSGPRGERAAPTAPTIAARAAPRPSPFNVLLPVTTTGGSAPPRERREGEGEREDEAECCERQSSRFTARESRSSMCRGFDF